MGVLDMISIFKILIVNAVETVTVVVVIAVT